MVWTATGTSRRNKHADFLCSLACRRWDFDSETGSNTGGDTDEGVDHGTTRTNDGPRVQQRQDSVGPPPLSPELTGPLSLFTSLLTTLVASYPAAVATTLYRRIAVQLSTSLYDRLLVNRTWSEAGAHQLNADLEQGFLAAGRQAGIRRGVARGWDKLIGGAIIMALPATATSPSNHRNNNTARGSGGHRDDQAEDDRQEGEDDDDVVEEEAGGHDLGRLTFSKVMQLAFDDAEPEGEGTRFNAAMERLGVGEVLGKVDVQLVMRRRPECWR